MKFNPCNGECSDEGLYCKGCGRSHQEIEAMRRSVDDLIALVKRMNYDNTDDFANAVAGSIKYHLSQS